MGTDTADDSAGIPAAYLWTTVVRPYTFGRDAGYSLKTSGALSPGRIHRIPVLVPPGATSMNVLVDTPKGAWGSTALYVYDPNGHPWRVDSYKASSKRASTASARVGAEDLAPGTWEIVVYGSFRNKKASKYDLSVDFRGVRATPVRRYRSKPGHEPTGSFTVVNTFDTRFSGQVTGTLSGFRKTRKAKVEGDTWESQYSLNDELSAVDLVLTLDPNTYNRFTDVAVNVIDDAGNAVLKEGFVSGVVRLKVRRATASSFTLQVRGAFAKYSDDPWTMKVRETYEWAAPIGTHVTLYPHVKETLTFTLAETPPKPPTGYRNHGVIRFRDRKTKQTWLEVPMSLD